MFPFGSLGVSHSTVKEVEFVEVIVSERTLEGATKCKKASCYYLRVIWRTIELQFYFLFTSPGFV
jgi:hypothetical protein